jgi:2-methylisocitrate lyase-like PEP mutase family enzyme
VVWRYKFADERRKFGAIFRDRAVSSGCFVLPNPWDAGTAVYLQQLGFKALATISAGFAFSRGKPDGAILFGEMLPPIDEVVAATRLPVNADS